MEISGVKNNQPLPVNVQAVTPELQAENREVIEAVKAINAAELFGQNSELTFIIDRETRRPLVRIVDRETKEVLQQIPTEYAIRMAEEGGVIG
jgi:flagellar protein FlaG